MGEWEQQQLVDLRSYTQEIEHAMNVGDLEKASMLLGKAEGIVNCLKVALIFNTMMKRGGWQLGLTLEGG